jgi:alkylated DNA repair dioxygenase AlkB
MAQLTLFDSAGAVLVDDGRGQVSYSPRFVDAASASAWFRELRDSVAWHGQRRMMYDREVDVPRLMGQFRLDPPADDTPPSLLEAARRLAAVSDAPFNSVGLNLYRDGRDSVAPHNDHLDELREGFPIALISLGATRRMTIRAKAAPRTTVHVDLEPGSLLVMDYATQLHYTHGVPKTVEAVGERISLAFRVRRPRDARPADAAGGFYR